MKWFYRVFDRRNGGDAYTSRFFDTIEEARKELSREFERLTTIEQAKRTMYIQGWKIEANTAAEADEIEHLCLIGVIDEDDPRYTDFMGDPDDDEIPEFRTVKGYGIEEYGVEWGYKLNDRGELNIYVADSSNVEYVDTVKEAEQICADLIEQWKL